MNIFKITLKTFFLILLSSKSMASPVHDIQRMLNKLGYTTGAVDGISGKLTINALQDFYRDNDKVFDGNISSNEIIDLKSAVSKLPKLDFDTIKKNGMITLFGNYISSENKVDTAWGSHYYLPSDSFAKKLQHSHPAVYWINNYAWGNLNGDTKPDLVIGWELRSKCEGLGAKDLVTGTWFCEDETFESIRSMLPFSIYKVSNSGREDLAEKIITKPSIIPRNCQRPLTADFNSDGIDDLYCPSATNRKVNGKRVYGGADLVFISNSEGQWAHRRESGALVNKKHGTYMGFSHGATVADIENDGDLDVLTTHVEWSKTKGGGKIYCHVNDGEGNFTVKWCADQFAHSITSGDYDGDGKVDIMVSGGWHQSPAYNHNNSKIHQQTPILFGDGSGKFGKKRKWNYLEPSYDIYGSGFLFPSLIGPVSWDFDGDGDVDIAATSIGPLYVGGTHTVWENDGMGNFTVSDQVPMVPSPKKFSSRKVFKQKIKMETNQYNSYCARSVLIDLNEDGMMDIFCDAPPQSTHNGWFFLNKGNLVFEKISPYKAWKKGWADYYTNEYDVPNRKFDGFFDSDLMETNWFYKRNFK